VQEILHQCHFELLSKYFDMGDLGISNSVTQKYQELLTAVGCKIILYGYAKNSTTSIAIALLQ
jgi:hypothetical protein